MMKASCILAIVFVIAASASYGAAVQDGLSAEYESLEAHGNWNGKTPIGDLPAVSHIRQEDIDNRRISLYKLIGLGESLFTAEFNTLDGFGDPSRDGLGDPNVGPRFNRVDGPDTQTCLECHNKPVVGGGAPQVSINFLLPLGPRPYEVRNSPHLFGAGPVQRLAEEMTADLLAIQAAAIASAQQTGQPVTVDLITKGVSFGQLTANSDGSVDTSAVEGVDTDLIITPFGQKGAVLSIRAFSVPTAQRHHGMQAVELVGLDVDADGDGVVNELTVGDVTAMIVFQAALPVPTQYVTRANYRAVAQGKHYFYEMGCIHCHRPALTLKDPVFREPNPLNPSKVVSINLLKDIPEPRPKRGSHGSAIIELYGDLKRHDMGPGLAETAPSITGASVFITKELWGIGSDGPWLHDGRATTLNEAIMAHGGEAQDARDQYAGLPEYSQRTVVEFLKSLQIPVH